MYLGYGSLFVSFGFLCQGCGPLFYFACPGLWVLFYLVACEACAQYVGDWLYLFYQVVFVLGLCPSSYDLGEVLSVFCFF